MALNDEQYAAQLERVCQLGCDSVRQLIRHLAMEEWPPELESLSSEQRHTFRAELETIMAVYDAR